LAAIVTQKHWDGQGRERNKNRIAALRILRGHMKTNNMLANPKLTIYNSLYIEKNTKYIPFLIIYL